MNLLQFLTPIVAVYALILAVFYLVTAGKRSWIMAVVRIGITVVSAIVAIPLTQLLAGLGADRVYEFLLPRLGKQVSGFLTEVPVGAEGMRVIAALLVSPVLYLLVFLILRWLVSVLAWIVEKCVPVLNRRSLRGVSMPLGALNGMLIAVVTLIPLCGYMVFSAHLLNTFVDSGVADTALVRENLTDRFGITEENIADTADSLEQNPVVKAIHGTVGAPVYTALTTAELDVSDTHGRTVELNLEAELSGLLVTAGHATEVADTLKQGDYTAEDKEVLFATADSLFESEWVKLLATDSLVALSEDWLKGESFAGIQRPVLDSALNPTVNHILEVLSDETAETLEEDVHVLLDVVGELLVHDLLVKNPDYTVMVQRLGTSGLLTDVLEKLETNQRMHVLAVELKSLSIRMVTQMLGTDQLQSGEYAEMMDSVAGTLTDVLDMPEEERNAVITQNVQTHFKEQGFDVPAEVVLEMSNQILDDLGSDGEITADELTDYLVNHADEGFDFAAEVLPGELPEGYPAEVPTS